jgi:hypothetical protein
MMLVAKDGVYLMQIPRKIEGMLLPPGGRAELLVRVRVYVACMYVCLLFISFVTRQRQCVIHIYPRSLVAHIYIAHY